MAKREIQEINAGSMADIAFLLLIFFLVTTTMDTDTGLARRLPPMPDPNETPPPPINERNVFIVLINSQDQLLVEGEPADVRELRQLAKEFIANPENKEKLPKKELTYIDELGRSVEICKQAVISLQNDNGTSYAKYIEVQNELIAAYNELRNEFARKEWNKDYADLNEEQQEAVRKVYKQVISESEPKNLGE